MGRRRGPVLRSNKEVPKVVVGVIGGTEEKERGGLVGLSGWTHVWPKPGREGLEGIVKVSSGLWNRPGSSEVPDYDWIQRRPFTKSRSELGVVCWPLQDSDTPVKVRKYVDGRRALRKGVYNWKVLRNRDNNGRDSEEFRKTVLINKESRIPGDT